MARARASIPASNLGEVFFVDGKYIEFFVVSATFGIRDYAFTGAPNPEDITGGRRTPVWAEKTPDHRGLVLTSAVEVDNDGPDLVIKRSGTGDLDMKIQAKDCAQGGMFQMEPERGDHTATLFTHVLAAEAVLLRQSELPRAGRATLVPYKDTTVLVPSRVNIANNFSRKFVARDSAQVAERIDDPNCPNSIPTRFGTNDIVAPLRRGVALGSGKRRPHGLRDRRGCGRGGATGDRVHPGLPGAEPGPRTIGGAGLPLPGAGATSGSSRASPEHGPGYGGGTFGSAAAAWLTPL